MEEKKKVFISTAIPYVNARPHIGFALELIQADTVARFYREKLGGENVFFLTGTDENSLNNVKRAEEEGVGVKEFVNKNAGFFKELTEKLNISNNDFIRTAVEERHTKGAQKLWSACRKEDIYKKKYKGLYCAGCEEFKTEKELVEGRCEEHPNRELEKVEEENYFFKLSNYQERLQKLIELGELEIKPETRRNEILKFIEGGLQDFSISRSRERAKDWGVKVPRDESQIMYVWFDALANYITALGYAEAEKNFREFWESGGTERIHIIGKGINRFHSVYWPAMLMSAGLKPPSKILVHGYVTVEGQKMSKSVGNVVDPFWLMEKYGADAVRYYLLREMATGGDGDFSVAKFEARYNGDLANGLGNFTSRVLKLAEKEGVGAGDLGEFKDEVRKVRQEVGKKIEEFRLNEAVGDIGGLIQRGDKYINDKRPWESGDKEVIGRATALLLTVAELFKPFLPETAEKIRRQIEKREAIREPLFPRLEVENKK